VCRKAFDTWDRSWWFLCPQCAYDESHNREPTADAYERRRKNGD
jgi:hypothetical protein